MKGLTRQRVIDWMPVLSYHFGLSPSDIWGMTHDEFTAYIDLVEEIRKANES